MKAQVESIILPFKKRLDGFTYWQRELEPAIHPALKAYVAELVGKTDRTIMNIENKGQHPSFNLFFKLVTLFDISVDQFFYTEGQRGENSCRKHIDVLLSSMNEKELVVMEATAEGLKKARETEVPE